jgi:hypothetical protein
VGFGLALLVGYGAFALSYGDDPILPMPSAAPGVLLLVGLLTAVTITGVATVKARRGPDAMIENMLAAAWLVGLIYLAGGVAHRDVLQYGLGAWLAVTSPAALLLHGANVYCALAGGVAYLVAAVLEPSAVSPTVDVGVAPALLMTRP